MNVFFPPGLVIVLPSKQAVVQERDRLLQQSGAGVMLRPKVMSFSHLERRLIENLVVGPSLLSDQGRRMILEKLVAQKIRGLIPHVPSDSARNHGVVQRISVLLDEARLGGLTPERFMELSEGWIPRERAQALADIQHDYETLLTERSLIDEAGQRRQLISALNAGRLPDTLRRAAIIEFKGFNRLTPYQTELVRTIGQVVPNVRLNLDSPMWIFDGTPDRISGRAGPFLETLRLIAEIEYTSHHDGHGLEMILNEPGDGAEGDLAVAAKHLFDPDFENNDLEPQGQVRILACTGRYHEVEEIGRAIWELIQKGVEPDRIAVGVRDLGIYGDMVEDVFRRFRLPLFMRRGAPLSIQAPARAVTALLKLAASNFERELFLDLLASPYLDFEMPFSWVRAAELTAKAGVTDDRAGGGYAENLKRLARSGSSDKKDAETLLKRLDALRDLLRPLARPQTLPDFVSNIRRILKDLKLEAKIQESPPTWLKRDLTALSKLWDCLDELESMAELTGALEPIPPDELVWTLNRAMDESNLGERGQGAGGIRVLSVFDLHGLDYDHLFLVGLGEKEFPKPEPEGILVEDHALRNMNRAQGKRVFTTSAVRYRQEEIVFYHALAAARQGVVCTYTCSDEHGRLMLASPLVDELSRLFPEGSLQVEFLEARNAVPYDRVLTRPELLGRMAWDALAKKRDNGALNASLMALADHPEILNRWQSIQARYASEDNRRTEDRGIFAGNVGSESVAPYIKSLRVNDGNVLVSPTLLEDFGACPFAFWAARIVGLKEPEAPSDEVHPLSRGAILHAILQKFLTQARDKNLLPLELNDQTIELLKTIAQEEMDLAEKRMVLGRTPLWQAKQREIFRTLDRWLQFETGRTDGLVPQWFEWSFGPEDQGRDAPPLGFDLSDGERLLFQGRVDRIDVSDQEAWVLDYKDSKSDSTYKALLKPELMGLISFQPPVYQLAAARHLSKPAKAGYILLRKLTAKPALSPGTGENLFTNDPEQRRRMAEQGAPNFLNHLDVTWQKLTQGRFGVNPKDDKACQYCDFRIACRKNSDGEVGEAS